MQQLCLITEAEFRRGIGQITFYSGVADIVAEQLAESTKTRGRLLIPQLLLFSSLFLTVGFLWKHFVRLFQLTSLFLRFMRMHCVSRQELQWPKSYFLLMICLLKMRFFNLNIGFVTCDITPEQLLEALKQEIFPFY